MKHTRIAFNTGEVCRAVSLRMDVDALSRACTVLENWEVSDLGGIKRRRGLKEVGKTVKGAALIPYIYSYADVDDVRFLVEVRPEQVNVMNMQGEVVAFFVSGMDMEGFSFVPQNVRYKQINKLLILTSLEERPMVIKYDGLGGWVMESYRFKMPPWKETAKRDRGITITKSTYGQAVQFEADEDANESAPMARDILRASYRIEQRESRASAATLTAGINSATAVPETASKGSRYAVRGEEIVSYWVVKQDWPKSNYCPGLDDPGSYPDNFIKAENTSEFESVTPVTSVKSLSGDTIKKDTKVAIRSGYWEYYTCIKYFSKPAGGSSKFSDYPNYFVRGIAVGDALTCKGAWSFFCSGLWYGSYEVRRNYDTSELDENWEARGVSFSQIASPSNIQITGTEEEEECYLRLFLTRSRYMGAIKEGFPPDSCDNKLIVESYMHDELLECHVSGGLVYYENVTPIRIDNVVDRVTYRWSWQSFSPRYGYPLHCEWYNQRLIFAATPAQPQTIWMSKVNDLTDFTMGTNDDAGMELTLADTSQNAICWISKQKKVVLLGTSNAEWILSSSGGGGITSQTAQVDDHGYNGSAGVPAIRSNDKILYVGRGGGRVYEMGYYLESDGYASRDLTQLAPHIAEEHQGIVRSSFATKPRNNALFVLGDGQLALCTYNTTQQVNAWNRWVTEGRILEAVAMPNGNADDLIFLIVERGEEVNIEVYSPENEYTDGGRDYVSTVVTNSLANPLEREMGVNRSQPISIRLDEEVDLRDEDGHRQSEAVEVSGNGQDWISIDRRVLKAGWDTCVPDSTLQWEPTFGLRVRGQRGLNLLCVQA